MQSYWPEERSDSRMPQPVLDGGGEDETFNVELLLMNGDWLHRTLCIFAFVHGTGLRCKLRHNRWSELRLRSEAVHTRRHHMRVEANGLSP